MPSERTMQKLLMRLIVLIWLFGSAAITPAADRGLPQLSADEAGMDADRLVHIDDVVQEGLDRGRMPGCVVLVGRSKGIVLLKAYGQRQVQPTRVAMTIDTVFDLASLTKPIATATCVMKLAQEGRLDIDDAVAKHIPEFAAEGKEKITIRQLLTHQGGLIADNALSDYADGPDESMQRVYSLKPQVEPGTRFIYSDVGFIVLGEVVARITGKNLHEFSHETIFQPLGMSETGFLPSDELKQRAAPTEQRANRWMRGEVHDPRAFRLGGVAGHAGLFSTAEDLARFARMMLGGGDTRVLKPETIALMTKEVPVSSGIRGLGWDKRSTYSSNRGDLFTKRAFGHGGFTGTAIWIDPALDVYVIFLSNRVHPDGQGSVNSLAGRIGTIAAAAIR